MAMRDGDGPIFFDPTGRRAVRLSWIGWIGAIVAAVAGAALASSILIVQPVGDVATAMSGSVHRSTGVKASALSPEQLAAKNSIKLRNKARAYARRQGLARNEVKAPETTPADSRFTGLGRPAERALSIGFYVTWDANSFPALQRALPHLDWIIPGWLSLQGRKMSLTSSLDNKALDLIRTAKPDASILPMIQNAMDGTWEGANLAYFLADPMARSERLQQIVTFLETNHLQGLTIDFEEVPRAAQPDLKTFLREMAAAFKPHGWIIVLAVPFHDDDWDYQAYAKLTDYLLLMAYDEHWKEGAPGSIAGADWFERILDRRMQSLDPAHTIIAIGNYGYDWVKGGSASDVTFQHAALIAHKSEADIEFDPATQNPHYSYIEHDGKRHEVWFLDGVTSFNQIHAADVYRPAGYALWRLGSEDPSIWSVMGRPYDAPAPDGLRSIAAGDDVSFDGKGEFLRVVKSQTPGARTLEIDPDTGNIIDQTYTALPTPYVVQRFGVKPGKIALTFDDGPDPVWTLQILDILRGRKAPATFFIIGENAVSNPELVRRMVAEGHDVGNHTYSHPNTARMPNGIIRLEFNATQRIFEALTGRSMRFARPPYFGDAEPPTREEIVPAELAQSMGYTTVGLDVDPSDWRMPAAGKIVERVLAGVSDPDPEARGQVVLLHDAGGDRSQTVLALPTLIDDLRARGYDLVTVSELAGLTRDQAMPPLPTNAIPPLVNRSLLLILGWFGSCMRWAFLAAIWLGAARLVLLCGLGLLNRHRETRRRIPEISAAPQLVSVLIPAHNEARVVAASLTRILASNHAALEVIVIDDGSTDATSDVVRRMFGSDPRVTLLISPNGGKARALNRGLLVAKGSVVVALDADTQFQPDTIFRLVRWFADPAVGAVAGNAKVGNRINAVTYLQTLEYVVAQNLERRALAALGCITVVPGAVGAWRRDALQKLGGFPTDTLAEDQDLTLAIQAAGYKALFDSSAIAWTEAPDTFKGLARQRFRWAYGTLQCLWKHRSVTFRSRYGALGLIALPQVWLFQILLSVLAPLIDLMFLWQIVGTGIDYLQHGEQFDPTYIMKTGLYFSLFVVVDVSAAVLAFGIEQNEKWRLLWWLTLQRFGYRQLMYYVVVKSALSALRGPAIGWGKLERKATVTASLLWSEAAAAGDRPSQDG